MELRSNLGTLGNTPGDVERAIAFTVDFLKQTLPHLSPAQIERINRQANKDVIALVDSDTAFHITISEVKKYFELAASEANLSNKLRDDILEQNLERLLKFRKKLLLKPNPLKRTPLFVPCCNTLKTSMALIFTIPMNT